MAVNKFGGRTKSACSLITRLCVAIDKERCLWHKWAKEERRIESYYKEPDLVFFVNFMNVEFVCFFLEFLCLISLFESVMSVFLDNFYEGTSLKCWEWRKIESDLFTLENFDA